MKKKVIALLVVVVVVAVVVVARLVLFSSSDNFSTQKDRSKGNPEAAIQIIEFIDFECPACAHGSIVLNDLMKDNLDDIFLQMKYFPLRMHRYGILSAQYAECAARQGKFWPMHDKLVKNQSRWRGNVAAEKFFVDYAAELDLDYDQLQACLIDEQTARSIESDQKEGRERGVRSTPTYFVNDKVVVGIKSLMFELTKLLNK